MLLNGSTIASVLPGETPSRVRVCKACGTTKPLSAFDLSGSSGTKYYRRTCRHCVYIEDSSRKKQIYGYATTPIKRERVRKRGEAERTRNLALYDNTDTPEEQIKTKERYDRKKEHNTRLFGFATDPERLEKIRVYYATKRTANLRQYRVTITPREQNQLKEKRIKQSADNRQLYGTALTPKQLEQSKQRRDKARQANMRLYGTPTNPKYQATVGAKRATLRHKVVQLYGGKCECCGGTDTSTLTFDHINGITIKGVKRSQTSRGGIGLVRTALVAYNNYGYPNNRYRLLCWNCNSSIGHYGYCPHSATPTPANCTVSLSTIRSRRVRTEMIKEYGSKCVLCGEANQEFLTIDHTNGGGVQHRRDLGSRGRGSAFYFFLKRQEWPKDGYRLLCYNCNCSVLQRRRKYAIPEEDI